jgi:hypothetical protein
MTRSRVLLAFFYYTFFFFYMFTTHGASSSLYATTRSAASFLRQALTVGSFGTETLHLICSPHETLQSGVCFLSYHHNDIISSRCVFLYVL